MAGLKVITPPAAEPVTLEEVKAQLKIDSDDSSYDDIINPLIKAAREWCEGYQNRAYITQTLELALDLWPGWKRTIPLLRPPLQSVTSVKYTDNGVETTWDAVNYIVDDYGFIAALVINPGINWPSASLPTVNGIKIRYIAGYPPDDADPPDLAANVPEKIKQAILLLVNHWFDNGMCDPPPAVYSLLSQDRVVPI